MAAEALTKMGDKLGLPTKVETNGSDGAKNVLTPEEIAACDGIIIAADKNVETARFDGKPVIFARVDDGIHKPEELIKKIAHGEAPIYRAEAGAKAQQSAGGASDSLGHSLYKHLMNGVSHMLPFVVGGGIMIALAFLLDDYTIDPSNFGMNTPVAAFFKTVGNAAFGYMLPILAGFIAMSIADRPGLAVGFAGGVLAMNGLHCAVPQENHREAACQPERHPPDADLPLGRYPRHWSGHVRHQPGHGHHQHGHDRLAERHGRHVQSDAGRNRRGYDEH